MLQFFTQLLPYSHLTIPLFYLAIFALFDNSPIASFLHLLTYRKEQEYQQQLRDQIDENKRKKEVEKRGLDKTKQKELQEYLRVQYKGDLPDHLKGTVEDSDTDRKWDRDRDRDRDYPPRGNRDSNRDNNNNSNGTSNGTSSKSNHNVEFNDYKRNQNDGRNRNSSGTGTDNSRRGNNRNNDDSDGYDGGESSSNRGKSGKSSGNRRSVDFDNNSGDDQESTGRDQKNNGRGRDRGRGNDSDSNNGTQRHSKGEEQSQGRGSQYQDKEGRWVSEAEYEELTALCDRLMSQQDRLQDEIQHQASLIKVSH